MAMYWTCKYGANHDNGEKCDCKRERDILEDKMRRLTSVDEKTKQITLNFKEVGREKTACY